MKKCKLKDVSVLITKGTTPTTIGSKFVNGGINFIKAECITSKYLDKKQFDHIDEATNKKLQRSQLNTDDLLFSIAGYLGKIGIVREIDLPANTNQAVAIVRIDPKKANVDYLYYYFSQKYLQKHINQLSSQSVQPNLNLELLGKLEFDCRELEKQKKIASMLSALDSKIDLNNNINAELNEMAKTLYDFWFVQYDFPNSEGRPYKTSGGKMVWSRELKKDIPDGWEVGTLLDIAKYTNGLPCQKYRPIGNESLRVIKIRELHEGFSADTEFVRTDIPHKVVIENGDVLFSWSASLEVQIWSRGKGALNQHIFKVTSDKYPKYYYYYQLVNYLTHFKMMAESRKTTMGHITQEHLEQSRVILPPTDITLSLEKIIAPIFSRRINCEVENQELTKHRDWLLPMLMNGQVKVN